jgi:hypothetical protein
MPKRPAITASGLFAESYGERPYTVTVREEKRPGTHVVLDYTTIAGIRRKPTLGYPVRRQDGRKWVWDEQALERAREEAQDRSAELRLARLREDVLKAEALTLGEAVALFSDPQKGGLPRDPKSQQEYLRALKRWRGYLGEDRPWNRIRRSEIEAWGRRREEEGKIPTLMNEVAVLRILYRWLDDKEGIEGLINPVKGFAWKRFRTTHRVRRPRYSQDELQRIIRIRHQVDPRFTLFLALIDDSGARRKAVKTLWRSAVDFPLDQAPTEEEAPFGWLLFPALKGQEAPLHLLTAFERRELQLAFTGYLQEMEEAWQAQGTDYPLFPGSRLGDKAEKVVGTAQAGAYRVVSDKKTRLWLKEAEQKAKVEHVEGRGYHGIRRAVSDLLYQELGLDALTTAMGWSSRDTPEQIYIDQRRMRDRVGARQAMERKRKGVGKHVPEP